MKIAVLANPGSGGGRKVRQTLEKICRSWPDHELFGAAGFGGETLPRCLKPEQKAEGYLPAFRQAMDLLLAEGPELLVTVGGDGTAAYAAEELLKQGAKVPLFGIGTGTANVGPIVTLGASDPLPDPEALKPLILGAVEALTLSGEHIAYGFNDLVLGNTFLGTDENGSMVTFSAKALARDGILKKEAPLKQILKEDGAFRFRGGAELPLPFPAAQLIAAPLGQDSYYGRAVTGLLCYTSGSPYQAALFTSPTPIVSMEESPAGYEEWLTGAQLLLKEGDLFEAVWPLEPVCVIADGNPCRIPPEGIAIRYVPSLLTVLARR